MLHICDIRSIFNRNTLSTFCYIFTMCTYVYSGQCSAVGLATAYVLDGLVMESWWGREFPHLFRPALRTIQSPVQWVPSLFRESGAAGA